MTPEAPSSSDGSPLPPRHRPTLGNLTQDTTELDLWAFDEDLEDAGRPAVAEQAKPAGKVIPAPREQAPKNPKDPEAASIPKTPTGGEDRIRMNVHKSRVKSRPAGMAAGQSKPEGDFDDLDAWEDTQPPAAAVPEIGDLPDDEAAPEENREMAETPELTAGEPPRAVEEAVSHARDDTHPEEVDELAPPLVKDARPVSLRPQLGLSNVERIGIAALAAVLLVAGVLVLAFSVFRLPGHTQRVQERDFPIQGEKIRIASAACYWRAPITEGENRDVCRRGTLLLPVIELVVSGGPCSLRVLFKDDEGNTVGDPILRDAAGGGTLKIPATAGFDDPGMYAAYRTGGAEPWTVQVFEAPAGSQTGGQAKLLFEMNIPADRR